MIGAVLGAPVTAPAAAAPADAVGSPTATVAARISGLVCDLCIEEVQAHLKALPDVTDAVADPRDGVVALAVHGTGPTDQSITLVLTGAGYAVHALTRSQTVSVADVRARPTQSMAALWGATNEQKTLLATLPARFSTCDQKGMTYGEPTAPAAVWGAQSDAHRSDAPAGPAAF